MVQPDSMSDDLGGKAMAVVRLRRWLDTVTVARVRSRCQTRLPRQCLHARSTMGFGILGSGLGRLQRIAPGTRRRQPVTRHRVAGSREIRLPQKTRVVSGQPRGHRAGSPRVQRIPANQKPSTRAGRPCKRDLPNSTSEMLRVQCQFGARVGFGGLRCAVLSRLSS